MEPKEFCLWLKGVLDGRAEGSMSGKPLGKIKEELQKVFHKETIKSVYDNPQGKGIRSCGLDAPSFDPPQGFTVPMETGGIRFCASPPSDLPIVLVPTCTTC